MAITLPPPQPPQQGQTDQLRQEGAEFTAFRFQSYTIHVLDEKTLTAQDLASAVNGAESLLALLRNLVSLYHSAGYPGAQLTYALAGQDVYVHTLLARVKRVDGPAELKSYFDDLIGTGPLTDGSLEPRNALASLYAERAGFEMSPVLDPDPAGGDQDVLDLQAQPTDRDPTSIHSEIGNPGNRYVGRHFLDLGARQSLTSGDEFSLDWRNSLSGLNSDHGGDDYHEETLGWNRITPSGRFGASARNVNYGLNSVQRPVNGDIRQAEIDWFYPLRANFRSRWTIDLQADYADKELSLQFGGDVLQHQEYGSVEAGTAYAYTLVLDNDDAIELGTALAIRKGLGKDKSEVPATLADLSYLLLRPRASAQYSHGEHWRLRLDLSGQITNDILPEQSQWLLGGIGNIDAYLPAVAAGDGGGLGRLQLEYQNLDEIYGVKLTPRAFVEYGYVSYVSNLGGLSNVTPAIADAGLELDASLTSYLDAGIAYARKFYDQDFESSVLDGKQANLYFRFAIKL